MPQADVDIDADVVLVEVASLQDAERLRFSGSPTVHQFVDGLRGAARRGAA